MSLPESYLKPVVQLLAQTASPFDVPADPEIFSESWLEPALRHALSLLDEADVERNAALSSTGGGLTHLFLTADDADDYAVHLRVAGEGDLTVREPQEKSVVLTLAGTMELEAFRHSGDVAEDTPWYVRQFVPENIYACHPGTLHSVEQSEEAAQLVISRNGTPGQGRALTADEYREALGRIRTVLGRTIEAHTALALEAAPGESR
ncbi:hypothetical protein [Streptomyces parvus]|uniref:hypothetical protein n=1 Tax=Streptomyces parvus TaxID=66428 RepID=UPI0033D834EA